MILGCHETERREGEQNTGETQAQRSRFQSALSAYRVIPFLPRTECSTIGTITQGHT